MSEPEIARRCTACGVSIRDSALYCPQCGEKVGPPPINDSLTSGALPEKTGDKTGSEKTGVAENVRDRVEKIKHVSSVMIDQAAYDPSLRFLLVAAVLFVLFLILLILSKVIG
jgi:zinc ribbon protein